MISILTKIMIEKGLLVVPTHDEEEKGDTKTTTKSKTITCTVRFFPAVSTIDLLYLLDDSKGQTFELTAGLCSMKISSLKNLKSKITAITFPEKKKNAKKLFGGCTHFLQFLACENVSEMADSTLKNAFRHLKKRFAISQ